MLARQAIVASGADAIGEILAHEEDALLVLPGDTEGLAAAIRRLAGDEPLRVRLGEAAREKALSALTPDVEQGNWLRVYETVVRTAGPRLAAG